MTHVLLHQYSKELNLDRSALRKYALRHGIKPYRVGNSLALSAEDIQRLNELRGIANSDLQCENSSIYKPIPQTSTDFYVVQVCPDIDPRRLKFGISTDVHRRMAQYRTLSPTAKLHKFWKTKPTWEHVAIDCATVNSTRYSTEVFDCDLVTAVERLDLFFDLMNNT